MADETPKITYTADDFKTKEAIDGLRAKCIEIVTDWDFNTNDSEGYTPLCFASMNGIKPDKLVYLIKYKSCSVNLKCGKGKTPLQCAILSGCAESVDALLAKPVNVYDDKTEEVVEDKNSPAAVQPKVDAAGNKVPLRDEDDNIIYKKDSNGVVYPLDPANLLDPGSVNSESAIQQMCKFVDDGPLLLVPPTSIDYDIVYKYEDDGSHTPMRNEDGDPIKQYNSDGTKIHKKDASGQGLRNSYEYVYDYEYQPEYATAYNNETVKINSSASVTTADLCEASKLPKADILKALGDKHKSTHSSFSYENVADNFDSTLLYSACMMSCYASVDYILESLILPAKRATYIIRPCGTDEDNQKSALAVAIENEDELLVDKLCNYLTRDVLDSVFESAFLHEWHSVINTMLLKVIGKSHIYDKSGSDYVWLTDTYQWDDSGSRSIINYIEAERNESLYDLLVNNTNYSNSDFNLFRTNNCCHIIAELYKNNKYPFNTSAKLNTLLNESDYIYSNTIAILFADGAVSLKEICDINEDTKRNKCVDKIFTSYNKNMMISLITTDSDHRNDVIEYLYNDKHYFTLDKLAALSGTPSITDSDLYDIIKYLEISLADINTLPNSDFKKMVIISLLKGGEITFSDIASTLTDSDFKNNIIVEAFLDSDVSPAITTVDIITECGSTTATSVLNTLYTDNKLEPTDIYGIYNHYSDSLSGLNSDLKPLIGSMKYSNKAIETDYYWAYKFEHYTSDADNWYDPQTYHSVPTTSMKSSNLQTIGNSGKYVDAQFFDGSNIIQPQMFRLYTHNNKPEFYVDQAHAAAAIDMNNGVIVKFNESVTTDKFIVQLGVVYLVDSTTQEISWNTDNAIFKLLHGKRCYLSSSSAINHAPTIVEIVSTSTSGQPGDAITLTALAFDQDGDPITYLWSGDTAYLSSTTDYVTTFTIPSDLTSSTTYTVTVRVSDDKGAFNEASISINAIVHQNVAPSITITTPTLENSPGNTVTLQASITDPDGDSFSYSWGGSEASQLVNKTTLSPSFTIPPDAEIGTTYEFTITAVDSHGASNSGTITVIVVRPATIGTLAFTTDTFAVDIDPDSLSYTVKNKVTKVVTQYDVDVKSHWGSVYSQGYYVQQVPKSPNYTDSNKVFTYDVLYPEDSDD